MKKNLMSIFICIVLIGMAMQFSPIQASSILLTRTADLPRIESEDNPPEFRIMPEQELNQWHPELPIETRYPHEGLPVRAEAQVYIPPTAEQLALTESHVRSFDCSTVTDVIKTECEALVALYNSTNGAGWANSTNWLDSYDLGTWFGVTLSDGQVTDVSLFWNQLSGTIPPELGNMANLVSLELGRNALSGSIPFELGNLVSLEYLNLGESQLSGSIPPELGNLTNLQSLILYVSELNGPIPPELGNLINLQYLYLNLNQLSGTIPSELGNLVNLIYLNIDENQLSGSIPTELGKLTNLQSLYLKENELTDSLPNELGNLTKLKQLVLNGNQFSGLIPDEIGNLISLNYLNISQNNLSGDIPERITNLVNLCTPDITSSPCWGRYGLDLGYNQLNVIGLSQDLEDFLADKDPDWKENQFAHFTSCEDIVAIPISECQALEAIFDSTNGENWKDNTNWFENNQPGIWYGITVSDSHVIKLHLGSNQLKGNIPADLGLLTYLEELSLQLNQIGGTIPSELGDITNLTYMNLRFNQISGSIPQEIGNLTNLRELYLDRNQLTGYIPPELGGLSNLEKLILGINQLTGVIPNELGNLTKLWELYLAYNQLSGSIPSELGNLSNLGHLSLANNQLSATIPLELGNLTNLQSLSLEKNLLTGTIPPELGNLSNLQMLYLNNNQLSSTIPSGLGNPSNLYRLNLSHNKLVGEIPESLTNLTNLCTTDVTGSPCWGSYGLDLGYNHLATSGYSQELLDFLDIKDPDWYLTQAVEETIIGETGGTIISNDGNTEIAIPPGAVEGDVTFTFAPQPAPAYDTGALAFAGNSFELTAQDSLGDPITTFTQPIIITLYYDEADLDDVPEENLFLYYWDDGSTAWMDVVTTCGSGSYTRNLEENWLSVPICHLSQFALMGLEEEPSFFKIFLPLITK